MKLDSLLTNLEYRCVQGTTDREVSDIVYDSRKVSAGDIFVCISGAVSDGKLSILYDRPKCGRGDSAG